MIVALMDFSAQLCQTHFYEQVPCLVQRWGRLAEASRVGGGARGKV